MLLFDSLVNDTLALALHYSNVEAAINDDTCNLDHFLCGPDGKFVKEHETWALSPAYSKPAEKLRKAGFVPIMTIVDLKVTYSYHAHHDF